MPLNLEIPKNAYFILSFKFELPMLSCVCIGDFLLCVMQSRFEDIKQPKF